MKLDPRLLEILACPQCHAPAARRTTRPHELVCTRDVRPGLPGARRHPGPAARRGPPPVTRHGRTAATVLDDERARRRRCLDGSTPAGCCARSPPPGPRSARRCSALDEAGARSRGRRRTAVRARVVVAGMGGSGIAGDVARRRAPGRPARCRSCRRAATGCPAGSARWTSSSPCPAPAGPRRRSPPPTRRSAAAPAWSPSAPPGSPLVGPGRRRPGRAPAGRQRAAACRARTCGRSPSRCCSSPTRSAWRASRAALLARRRRPARRGERRALRAGRRSRSSTRPRLALELAGPVPMVWGTAISAAVAALRVACQLAENAKYPAVHGALPRPTTTRSWRSTAVTARAAATSPTTSSATRSTTARRASGCGWCCCATPRSTSRSSAAADGRRAGWPSSTASPLERAARAEGGTRSSGSPRWSRCSTSPTRLPGAARRASTRRRSTRSSTLNGTRHVGRAASRAP